MAAGLVMLRVLVWAGCSLTLSADPPPPPLTVATNIGNRPYEYLDEKGSPAGFSNDLLRELERVIGRPIKICPLPFAQGREAFEKGELDALGTVIYTKERAQVMDFTVPTHSMTYILLIRKDDRSITSERDLMGKRVVVNRRNAVAEYFQSQGIPFQELSTNEACIQALAAGQADCAVAPKYTWLYLKSQQAFPNISMLPTEIYPSRRGLAVQKGEAQLLAQLNEGIFRLKENGTLDHLYAKHFAVLEASEVPFLTSLRRVALAALPILSVILLGGLALWSWSLKRVVRKRTLELRNELQRRSQLEADRERALSELTLYKAQLEELVTLRSGELQLANADLVGAKEAAETANRMKSSFLANMSHEIRTPMNAVTVLTHLALQTDLTEKQRQYLVKTKVAADSLLGIINDILDFSKIEAGKLQMDAKEFFLEEEFEKVTQLVGTKSAEKHLEFLLNIAPDVPPAWPAIPCGSVRCSPTSAATPSSSPNPVRWWSPSPGSSPEKAG
ncbi:MAG: transporter substrate-binding domain-containing protein [Holophagaceae bacterium]|uniref:histidine kinase n=1 Tax=Candidatus Geothrix skivensis TaxID=2954439 RepID=A0A9D7SCP0_9BACT|nr:transporter substrate-binding domain-containing protein [Candidatus Geothrix skivensis]